MKRCCAVLLSMLVFLFATGCTTKEWNLNQSETLYELTYQVPSDWDRQPGDYEYAYTMPDSPGGLQVTCFIPDGLFDADIEEPDQAAAILQELTDQFYENMSEPSLAFQEYFRQDDLTIAGYPAVQIDHEYLWRFEGMDADTVIRRSIYFFITPNAAYLIAFGNPVSITKDHRAFLDQFLQSITVDTSLAFPHDEPLQDESLTSQEQIVFDLPLKRTLVFDQDNTAQFMITAEDDGSMQGEIRCQFDGSDLSKEYARFIALSGIMRYAYGVENLTNTVVSASGEFGEICYRDGVAAPEEWTQTDGYAAIDLSDDELDQAIDEVCVLLDIRLL